MVLPDSHGVSRAPRYSGTCFAVFSFGYGSFTLFGATFQRLLLPTRRSMMQALQPRHIVTYRFRLIPVRSPLLRESRLISLPTGTEMFHFPALAPLVLYIQTKVTCCSMLGCPIQKPPDQRIFGSSPRLFAAYRVFHRLLAPRHPPIALIILVYFAT